VAEDRDEKLRHSILSSARIIGASTQGAWVGGQTLADSARDEDGAGVTDDDHAIGLLNWLVGNGLLEEEMSPHLGGEKRSLRHRRFKLTRKGWALWMGDVPPVPGVWDERLEQ
jgi:hypothetical protein